MILVYRIISLTHYSTDPLSRLRPLLCVLFHVCGQYYATHALVYIHIHTGRAHDVPGIGVFSAYRPGNGANTVGRSWRKAPNLPRGQWKWPITIAHSTIRTCRRHLHASITVLRCINDDICRLIKANDLLWCTLGNRLDRKNPKAIRYIIIL